MGQVVALANANYTHPDATTGGWTNPTYAYADDGSYATRTGTTKNVWYGNLYGFDLSTLPTNATLTSIGLEVQWKNDAADTSGPVLGLAAYFNGALVGTEATDTSGQTSDELLTKTPTGITVAQLRTTGAAGFAAGVRFRRTDNTAHTASIDYVKCTVDYTLALSGTASMSGADASSGSGKKATSGTATVSAVGTLVAVATIGLFGLGVMSGGGPTTASGTMGAKGTAEISCPSTVTATGEAGSAPEEHSGTVEMSGSGHEAASGGKGVAGGGAITCGTSNSADGEKGGAGTGVVTCGTLTGGGGEKGVEFSASLSCGSSATGSGIKATSGTASISGGGALSASGPPPGITGEATMSARGRLTAVGVYQGTLVSNKNGLSMAIGIGIK